MAAAIAALDDVTRRLAWAEATFPLYQMMIDGQPCWLRLQQAGVAYDNAWSRISIGGRVIESDGAERSITDEERCQISDIADDHSASK